MKKGVKILDKDSDEEFVWWRLDKTFFKLLHIFICSVYIPPQNSSPEKRFDTNHFERLQEKIYKFCRLGKIFLCGDFNARIGILDDYIYDPFLDHEINSAVPIDKRCSRDLQVTISARIVYW